MWDHNIQQYMCAPSALVQLLRPPSVLAWLVHRRKVSRLRATAGFIPAEWFLLEALILHVRLHVVYMWLNIVGINTVSKELDNALKNRQIRKVTVAVMDTQLHVPTKRCCTAAKAQEPSLLKVP